MSLLKTILRKRVYGVFSCVRQFNNLISKYYVLGIETSCDETGAAVVDENGKVHGEGLCSQMKVHLDYGGVIPHIASYLHKQNIQNVVDTALRQSNLNLEDISAFAATSRPGLKSSLIVGLEYGKLLAAKVNRPFIPIHHMEAHALTVRMVENVQFPFLVLLASGGHCEIAVAQSVDKFLLLGTSVNNTPGEVLDKVARRLKLRNLPQCRTMSGGQAIEFMAKDGNPLEYSIPVSLTGARDCNFSFSGYVSYSYDFIEAEERKHNLPADGVIPNAKDFCASLLHSYAIHLMHRVHRALIYCDEKNIMAPEQRVLVFSGGVACNQYLRNSLKELCNNLDCKFYCPPPKLCTDNGIMIAWNGIERLKASTGVYFCCLDDIVPESDSPLGIDLIDEVKKASIKAKLPKFYKENDEDGNESHKVVLS